jgi:hypothetical protein
MRLPLFVYPTFLKTIDIAKHFSYIIFIYTYQLMKTSYYNRINLRKV